MPPVSAIPEAWTFALLFSLPACIFLAAAALPCMAVAGLFLTAAGGRSLYERCARQLAGAARLLLWLLVLACGGLFFAARPHLPLESAVFRSTLLYGGGLFLAATLLWTLCAGVWKALRSSPVVLGLIAIAAWACLAALEAAGVVAVQLVRNGFTPLDPAAWPNLPALPLPAPDLSFWLALAALLFFGLAAGAGFGLVWLVLRRKADDFGRDYYTFAAAWCGKWAALTGWASLICLAALLGLVLSNAATPLETLLTPQIRIPLGGLFAPLALASVLWTAAGVSAAPMRHKAGMCIALFCLFISLACAGLLLWQ